jgi:hypothetical protein
MDISISTEKQALCILKDWQKNHSSKLCIKLPKPISLTIADNIQDESDFVYHTTFPIKIHQFETIQQYLTHKGFPVPKITKIGVAYLDKFHALQSNGLWLGFKEIISENNETNQWILKIFDKSPFDGVNMYHDVLDEHEILKQIWPYIAEPEEIIPSISDDCDLLKILFQKGMDFNIVMNFTRLIYNTDDIFVNLDVLQLGISKYSITGTITCNQFSRFENMYQNLKTYVNMVPVLSKVMESLRFRRPSMFEELLSKMIIPNIEEYYTEHICCVLPNGVICDYFH